MLVTVFSGKNVLKSEGNIEDRRGEKEFFIAKQHEE